MTNEETMKNLYERANKLFDLIVTANHVSHTDALRFSTSSRWDDVIFLVQLKPGTLDLVERFLKLYIKCPTRQAMAKWALAHPDEFYEFHRKIHHAVVYDSLKQDYIILSEMNKSLWDLYIDLFKEDKKSSSK